MLEEKLEVLEEKLAIAKELGMSDWVETRQQAIAEVKSICGLTFKPVDIDYINEALTERKYYAPSSANVDFLFMGTLAALGLFFGVLSIVPNTFLLIKHPVWSTIAILVFMQAINLGLCAWKSCEVTSLPLEEWKDNLPRGALLAMKEAKDQKIGNFRIYFPTYQKERVRTDPIIVGYKIIHERTGYSDHNRYGQTMLKIHEWDDGKIYEENKT